jgi:hypothetical protein
MKRIITLALLATAVASASAQNIAFNPGVNLQVFSTNSNDGYSAGRSVWFRADQNLTVQGAGFFNGFSSDDSFSMELFSATFDGSNLRVSSLASFTVNTPTAGDGYVDGLFGSAVNLVAGNFYNLEVFSNASFDRNHFYNWNGPGVSVSPEITILDGAQAGGLGNTVAPALRINAVPEPATMAVLGLGVAALVRRRRS